MSGHYKLFFITPLGISGETIQLESKTKEMVVKDGIKSSDSGTPFSFIKGNDSFKCECF